MAGAVSGKGPKQGRPYLQTAPPPEATPSIAPHTVSGNGPKRGHADSQTMHLAATKSSRYQKMEPQKTRDSEPPRYRNWPFSTKKREPIKNRKIARGGCAIYGQRDAIGPP
eukprot:GEMP01114357.1.p1 GENE.GEMP01114357.1~~GEMP01114357.1.p1  ORF type:complete len:111 (+),score=13.33 GEMP01114357.1:190-522(+)